jgi:hypothetical protein
MRNRLITHQLLLFLQVLLVGVPLMAAPLPQEKWVASAGTTWRDASGRHWAYLLWQAADPSQLKGKSFAVYHKVGEANSTNGYTLQTVVKQQADTRVIDPLLQRSVNIGQNLSQLEDSIDGLFNKVIPVGTLTLAAKLSAVIRGGDDAEHLARMVLLARRYPGAALALGMAWTEVMSASVVTYEIREHDPATGQDITVLGRLTLNTAIAPILPAPGVPVQLPEDRARADLTAAVRWASPDPLRRLAPLQHGFNLYRVDGGLAVSLGWNVTAPAPGVLSSMMLTNPYVHRVNRSPILIPKEFTAADVADFAKDGVTVFVQDRNDRYAGGPGFRDGDNVCYVVAASDLLGRDGNYSLAGCVTICDRIPPSIPRGVKVQNDYRFTAGGGTKHLKLTWDEDPSGASNRVRRYYIHRWNTRSEMHSKTTLAQNRVGIVEWVPGTRLEFVDLGVGSPQRAKDEGKVYWYTVHAVQETACGELVSGPSAPAYGILRDRVGPRAESPTLTIRNVKPQVVQLGSRTIEGDKPGAGLARYRFVCERESSDVAWAEFLVVDPLLSPSQLYSLGRHYFHPLSNRVSAVMVTSNSQAAPTVYLAAGLANGVSGPAQPFTLNRPAPGALGFGTEHRFSASSVWSNSVAKPGDTHYPRPLLSSQQGTAPVVGVRLDIPLDPSTKEWRVYRRLDGGDEVLLDHGEVTNDVAGRVALAGTATSLQFTDSSMPMNSADASYAIQLVDKHGNPGLRAYSTPVFLAGMLSAPTLLAVWSVTNVTATNSGSEMQIEWSSSGYGVTRYRIWIGDASSIRLITGFVRPITIPSGTLNSPIELTYEYPPVQRRDFYYNGTVTNLPCTVIETTKIGNRLGYGPTFTNIIDRTGMGDQYVLVEAIGVDGTVSEASNVLLLPGTQWKLGQPTASASVPWPSLPLPPLNTTNWTVKARRLTTGNYDGVGVRIGFANVIGATPNLQPPGGRFGAISGQMDPLSLLLRNTATGELLFGKDTTVSYTGSSLSVPRIELSVPLLSDRGAGVVMYRAQRPSARWPNPATDLVQVTPLMEAIAYESKASAPASLVSSPQAAIHDPFIGVFLRDPTETFSYGGYGPYNRDICLVDTQPMMEEAIYQYFLVRLGPNRELIEIIPTNDVEVTP